MVAAGHKYPYGYGQSATDALPGELSLKHLAMTKKHEDYT